MKVVLFCGGQGMRLREYSEQIPKPMVPIGYRPVLWHVMKYYAHFGHRDFILCLGYKADVIKNYFLNYDECASNDFVLAEGGKKIDLLSSDIHDWKITFVDSGINASIGERLKAVEEHVRAEEIFLANYSDGLTDCDLGAMVESFGSSGAVATFLSVCPNRTFHVVETTGRNRVTGIRDIREANIRINGGYFALRREIFDVLHEGEELVLAPFQRLIEREQLLSYPHDGFWMGMDTFKDRQELEDMWTRGEAPWQLWKS